MIKYSQYSTFIWLSLFLIKICVWLLFSVCKDTSAVLSLTFLPLLFHCHSLHSFAHWSSVIFSTSHAPPLNHFPQFLRLSHAHTNRWVVAIVSHQKHSQFIGALTALMTSVFILYLWVCVCSLASERSFRLPQLSAGRCRYVATQTAA